MELRHLQSFLVLAEELHFTRAAERIGISQPALSRQVQQLESEVGTPLVERTPRAVRLTPAGTELSQRLAGHITAMEIAIAAARAVGRGAVGRLAAGFTSNLSHEVIPTALAALRRNAPNANFELRELAPDLQIEALHRGELAVALTPMPSGEPALMRRHLFSDTLVAVVPNSSSLADQRDVSFEELDCSAFIICPHYKGGRIRSLLERCADAGFAPSRVQEVSGKTLMYAMVAQGMGVSIVPESSARGALPSVTVRPLRDPMPPIDFVALWRADADDPLRAVFVDAIAAAATEKRLHQSLNALRRPSWERGHSCPPST